MMDKEIQAEMQAEVKKCEPMTTVIPPQAMTVQNPVVQQMIVESPTKVTKQSAPKVLHEPFKVPKATKTMQKKRPKAKKDIKEEKIAKAPRKRKSQSNESEVSGNEQNAGQAKKQKAIAITKPTDHKGLDQKKLYCICKKPYNSKRILIDCDMCANWFHIGCTGISKLKTTSMSYYACFDCTKAAESASEELYRICPSPYDESQFYTCCDQCLDWFRCRRVGLQESEDIDEYICPNCQSKKKKNHANCKRIDKEDHEPIKKLLKMLMANRHAWRYMKSVNPGEAPDYSEVIKEPMDQKAMEMRLITLNNYSICSRILPYIEDLHELFK